MKPNFALSLSWEGIRLIHRTGAGWTLAGEVKLDAPDLGAELAALRKTALALEPGGLRTKLLLPNDQIKYLSLDTTRAHEPDVRAALTGATPYAVDDLVFDFTKGGGRTYIAAVARETLAEAEAFAAEHRFQPVCFAGVPDPFTYQGEAFFGATRMAPTLLPPGEMVERDAEPVRWTAPRRALPGFLAGSGGGAAAVMPPPVGDITAGPIVPADQPPPDVSPAPDAGESADMPPHDGRPTAGPLDEPTPAAQDIPAETDPEPAPPKVEDLSPVVAEAAPPPLSDAPPPVPDAEPVPDLPPTAQDLADVAPAAPAAADSPTDGPAPSADDPIVQAIAAVIAEPVQEPAVGDRPSGLPIEAPTEAPAETQVVPDNGLTADPPPPPLPVFSRDPFSLPDDSATLDTPELPASSADTPVGDNPVFTSRSRPLRADAGLLPPAPPLPPAGPLRESGDPEPVFRRRRGDRADANARVEPPVARVPPPPHVVTPPPGLTTAAPDMPRAVPPVTGEAPRAKVAAQVATPVVPTRAASETDLDDIDLPPPAPTLTPEPAPAPARDRRSRRAGAKAADDFGRRATRDSQAARIVGGKPRFLGLILTLLLIAALGLVAWWASGLQTGLAAWLGFRDGGATVVEVPDADLPPGTAEPATDTAVSNVGGTGPADIAADPGVLAALPDPVPQGQGLPTLVAPTTQPDQIAALAPESAALITPGALITPAEAERIYAATGVWLRAPRLPLQPRSEALDTLTLARADARPGPAVAQQAVIATGPDPGLIAQPLPPPPGVVFARDANGLIAATPEGTLLPSGIVVFAGGPVTIPPARPGTVAPVVTAAASATPPAATAATVADSPFRIRPMPRPTGLVVPAAPSTVADPVLPGAPTPSVTASPFGIRPMVRPADLVPAALALTTPPVGAVVPLGGVAFDGIRPAVRPDSLLDGRPPLVQSGFDGPRPAARPPGIAPAPVDETGDTPPPEADTGALDGALAAILAAPDPFAGASARAVAQAPRPDVRPRNFDRVVARATEAMARAAAPDAAADAGAGGLGTAALADSGGDEPDAASDAVLAPDGAVPGGVAQAATFEDAIRLRDINLIGVYGPSNAREALVRMGNGRLVRVTVGDNLDGGQVAAIGEGDLTYVLRGRNVVLEVPGG